MEPKAKANDHMGRFREIVSDPLNLAIRRDPRAGFVVDGSVYLHNGLRVPVAGRYAYYGDFSSILTINRGVHEPLEEFVFQEVLDRLPTAPFMLELGAYWGHYSMWLKSKRPEATVHLVEPASQNIQAGMHNFKVNGFSGEFVQSFVGDGHFGVDAYLAEKKIDHVSILHSDIQGYEMQMLENARHSLTRQCVDYLFVSTHSQPLHQGVVKFLEKHGYRVEVSSDFDFGTTSFDGFVLASSPKVSAVFKNFEPMSRVQINEAKPESTINYLNDVVQSR